MLTPVADTSRNRHRNSQSSTISLAVRISSVKRGAARSSRSTAGRDVAVDHVTAYVTTDGSIPVGSRGQASRNQLQRIFLYNRDDSLATWAVVRWLLAQP